ncbi:MAG TPA: asparagine--tRNA ligase, partial [Porphyromonadaceae bacterium]|nr:asparagine--tRNA ligase [Porphyromonadaceae bacterium]
METISRTKIVDAVKNPAIGTKVNVKGWVRTRRGNKHVSFVALNDGSTIHNIQVVIDMTRFSEEELKPITTGSCINVNGLLVESQGKGQTAEIQAEEIEIYGTADPTTYPLQKKGHTLEFLREIAHLRPRTNTFGAVLRIRHAMAFAIHNYFNQKGFFYLHTPIITASDAEGAGQMFQVTTLDLENPPRTEEGKVDYSQDFFGKHSNLTVSGQLEGELGAMALGAIYTFGPTFRAENSNTPRHLAEFWMVEPEVAFNEIKENMDLAEDFLKYLIQYALDNCKDDLEFLCKMWDNELIDRLNFVVAND